VKVELSRREGRESELSKSLDAPSPLNVRRDPRLHILSVRLKPRSISARLRVSVLTSVVESPYSVHVKVDDRDVVVLVIVDLVLILNETDVWNDNRFVISARSGMLKDRREIATGSNRRSFDEIDHCFL
jgi:hypothetical protein